MKQQIKLPKTVAELVTELQALPQDLYVLVFEAGASYPQDPEFSPSADICNDEEITDFFLRHYGISVSQYCSLG